MILKLSNLRVSFLNHLVCYISSCRIFNVGLDKSRSSVLQCLGYHGTQRGPVRDTPVAHLTTTCCITTSQTFKHQIYHRPGKLIPCAWLFRSHFPQQNRDLRQLPLPRGNVSACICKTGASIS